MSNRLIVADAKNCIGCHTCELACVMSHNNDISLTKAPFQPRLKVIKGMSVTVPVMCKHCENAPCANACPTGAIVHQNESIQVIQSRCIGCKSCVIACPFGAMVVISEALPTVEGEKTQYQSQALKCDLCDENPAGPACVAACPTNALKLVEPKSLEQLIKEKQLRTAKDETALFS